MTERRSRANLSEINGLDLEWETESGISDFLVIGGIDGYNIASDITIKIQNSDPIYKANLEIENNCLVKGQLEVDDNVTIKKDLIVENSSKSITLRASDSIVESFSLTLPRESGLVDQFLMNDGYNNLTWKTINVFDVQQTLDGGDASGYGDPDALDFGGAE